MIECPNCNNEFSRVGQHFSLSDCDYPDIDSELEELLVGLLLGDGMIQKTSKNGNLLIRMTNRQYLNWINEKVPDWITTNSGVYLDRTANESSKLTKAFDRGNNVGEHRDYWGLKFTKHPKFTDMRNEWYDNSHKAPPNITLSSKQVKHWYVADGNLHIRKSEADGRPQSSIYATDLIKGGWDISVFNKCPVTPRMDDEGFYFNADETEVLLDWIGEPVSGFEYKWETERNEYMKKKDGAYNQKI